MKKLLLILALLINSAALPQAVNTLKVDSLYSSDGPVVIHENGNIFEAGILPGGGTFTMYKKYISVGDTLSCYVDETGQSFTFTLKDKIETEKDVYEMPSKMLMVSDIEGNFNGFQMILKGAGVIDENFRWTFGAGHLVIDGDMFDRSLNVTECLWLIYKLEGEAENAGGKVHFVMGNHDVMNLKGDYRYLRKKYLINADSL
ncbi:MAG TPA: metallophosphoesterase, partial [Ignavibacteria bacterium]|nr:metallophosphoesterase [Ignavibacteria bacterium]